MNHERNIYLLLQAATAPDDRLPALAQEMGRLYPSGAPDWTATFALTARWGLKSIVWAGYSRLHALLPPTLVLPVDLKLKWYSADVATQALAVKKREDIERFARLVTDGGVREMVVMKGTAYARFYPHNEWREYGDCDCFVFDDYDVLHRIAKEHGAVVDEDHYKHSHVIYRGLTVENHRFLTSFGGARHYHRVEHLMEDLLRRGPLTPLDGTPILQPSTTFTALFLPLHALRHFTSEHITLRHILDWLFFLRTYGGDIDWKKMYGLYDLCRLHRGVDLMTQYCVERLGLSLDDLPGLAAEYRPDARLFALFERDIVAPAPSVGGERFALQKVPRILRRFRRQWRFRALLEISWLRELWITVAWMSYLHRMPHLSDARFPQEEVEKLLS